MSTTSIPLSKLQISPSNVRHPVDGDPANDVHDLQASILVHGLMNPLLVHALKKPRGYFGVYAGGRRLRALQGLAADGRIETDRLVDCYISTEAPTDLTEASLAENLVRIALKPGAEFEAFAALAAQGMTDTEIAARYAVPVLHVQQRRRLGRLHPDIMAALNAGPPFTLDLAKAYAATEDQALQKRVFDELGAAQWNHTPPNVRNAIRGGAAGIDADRMLKVVGVAAYLDAGGTLETDFFTDQVRVERRGTLEELYYAKVAAQQEALAATLPETVTVVTSGAGIGSYIHTTSSLGDEQRDRLAAIDTRTEAIHVALEQLAEEDGDGALIAVNAARQPDVDTLMVELDALETESEAIHGAAVPELPEGPVVALAEPGPGGMTVKGYYRPAGWRDPAAAGATGAAGAVDPSIAAKADTGLTKEGVEVMRSHRRAILRGAIVTDNADLGHRFLIFTLARLALNNRAARGPRGYHHDYASNLGIAGGLPSTSDPVGANEVAEQEGAKTYERQQTLFAGRPWMTEKDPAKALPIFLRAGDDEVEQVAAMLGAYMLDRSLQAAGMRVAMHDALAAAMSLEDAEIRRRYWTPTAAEFEWIPKARKLELVAEISPRASKQIGKLPTADIGEACARFFRADAADVREFGLVDAEARYARMWLPAWIRMTDADPPWVVARGAARAIGADDARQRLDRIAEISAMDPPPAVIKIRGRAWYREPGGAWADKAPDAVLDLSSGTAVINRFLWLSRLLEEIRPGDTVEIFAAIADYRVEVAA